MFHRFEYLRNEYNSRLPFNQIYPDIFIGGFKECDRKHLIGNAMEAITPNAPEHRREEVYLQMYVDSNHAG